MQPVSICVTEQTRDYSQLSNIMGQVCVSSGNLCSVIGHDRVADTLNTPAYNVQHTLRIPSVTGPHREWEFPFPIFPWEFRWNVNEYRPCPFPFPWNSHGKTRNGNSRTTSCYMMYFGKRNGNWYTGVGGRGIEKPSNTPLEDLYTVLVVCPNEEASNCVVNCVI